MEKGQNKVVLVALNAKFIHSSLSVHYLASGIRQSSIPIEPIVFESTTHEDNATLITRIMAHGAFAVCFSCYIWNIEKVLQLSAQIKALSPSTQIVLGGPEAEHNAEQLLRNNTHISCISVGEGEESLPPLLALLSRNMNCLPDDVAHASSVQLRQASSNISGFNTLNGVAYLEGFAFIHNKAVPLKNDVPSPYSEQYMAMLSQRMAYIETSRGCPYSCAFCLSGAMCSPKYFSISRAEKDILLLANSGAKTIKFIDRTFNAKASHANAIWQFIANNYGNAIPSGIRFHFEIAADILNDESLAILKALPCGAVQLEAGIQSVNEQTLCAVRRKTNTARLLQNLQSIISFQNLHLHIDLIAGLPCEGLQSFREGFNRVYPLHAHMLQLGFLKLLHGSAMRCEPESYPCAYDEKPPYEVYSTPWLSGEDIALIKRVEDALERLYNSQRFLLTLDYVLATTSLSPFDVLCAIDPVSAKTTLEDYTLHVLESFKRLPNIDSARLRDIMSMDYLSFNSTGRLPAALMIHDTRLRAAVKALCKSEELSPLPQTKRGVALLYSENAVVYVDYIVPDTLTGRYPLCKQALAEIGL